MAVKITAQSYPADPRSPCTITIELPTKADMERLEGALRGAWWMIGNESGGVDTHWRFDPIELTADPIIGPHFEGTTQQSTLPYRQGGGSPSACDRSIFVTHITGYAGERVYEKRAALLESAGFVCLRSRRSTNGQFWELWYLPDPVFAPEPFKQWKQEALIRWLCETVNPGNISTTGRTLGLCLGD